MTPCPRLVTIKKRISFWCVAGGLLVAIGWALAREWRQRIDLQHGVTEARARVVDLKFVGAENERLRQNRTMPEELARLRADHAALPRLRAELQALSSEVSAGDPAARR